MDFSYSHITQLKLFKGILHFVKCKSRFIGCQLFFDFFKKFCLFFHAPPRFNRTVLFEEITRQPRFYLL
jgi:hypothetical protein